MKIAKRILLVLFFNLVFSLLGFYWGILYHEANTEPVVMVVETEVTKVVYRYPNTPPFEEFVDPIEYDQVLALLYGMRNSHVQVLNWTWETDPGFGIADKEFQKKVIKWYDQIIDFVRREYQP